MPVESPMVVWFIIKVPFRSARPGTVLLSQKRRYQMRDSNLFSIGEVSRITGVHIKSLRYYDRIGVFKPAYIDKNSGYRYYNFEQLQQIIAIRICLETGLTLSELEKYRTGVFIDYLALLTDTGYNIDREIKRLEKARNYLEFLNSEVRFNDGKADPEHCDECYGSISLWAMPFEGGMDSFDRKEAYVKMAKAALEEGYQISPLYFGMMMKCSGKERKLYTIAGIYDFLHIDEEESPYICHTPEAWYRRAYRHDLDVTEAEKLFPDLFGMNYDKTVLTTISLQSTGSEPVYSMFINLPE